MIPGRGAGPSRTRPYRIVHGGRLAIAKPLVHEDETLSGDVLHAWGPRAGTVGVRAQVADTLVLTLLCPGYDLTSLPEPDGWALLLRAFARLHQGLHRPVPSALRRRLPDLRARYRVLQTVADSHALKYLKHLRAQTAGPVRLLHGDLHHGNVLWDRRRGWQVIDPKGVLGPPLAEVGPMLANPLETAATRAGEVWQRRVESLAQMLHCPPQQVACMAYVHARASVHWGGDPDPWRRMAAVMDRGLSLGLAQADPRAVVDGQRDQPRQHATDDHSQRAKSVLPQAAGEHDPKSAHRQRDDPEPGGGQHE